MRRDNLARLRRFVGGLALLLDSHPDEPEILRRGGDLLAELVSVDDWLPEPFDQPVGRYAQYLLHCDSLERFSVVSFVWSPGQGTPIHNHTVWGLIGMLRGAEIAQAYEAGPGGLLPGDSTRLTPGQVVAVSPRVGDVHSVTNALADRSSISIHVYGGNIGGVQRSVFDLDGRQRPFMSGYSNTVTPNLWNGILE